MPAPADPDSPAELERSLVDSMRRLQEIQGSKGYESSSLVRNAVTELRGDVSDRLDAIRSGAPLQSYPNRPYPAEQSLVMLAFSSASGPHEWASKMVYRYHLNRAPTCPSEIASWYLDLSKAVHMASEMGHSHDYETAIEMTRWFSDMAHLRLKLVALSRDFTVLTASDRCDSPRPAWRCCRYHLTESDLTNTAAAMLRAAQKDVPFDIGVPKGTAELFVRPQCAIRIYDRRPNGGLYIWPHVANAAIDERATSRTLGFVDPDHYKHTICSLSDASAASDVDALRQWAASPPRPRDSEATFGPIDQLSSIAFSMDATTPAVYG